MAAVLPPALLPGFTLLDAAEAAPSQGIFIPLASLPALTAGEANETTGDGRKVAYELTKALQTNYAALADNAKPAKMAITKATPTGINPTTVRQAFTASFDLDFSAADVAPEA